MCCEVVSIESRINMVQTLKHVYCKLVFVWAGCKRTACSWGTGDLTQLSFVPFFRLQKLSFARNQLTYVPASLFQVKTLKKLNLSHNHITSLAGECIEGDEPLDMETWTCTSLKVLNLSNNALRHLPAGIYGSTALVRLYVGHNKLKDFPTPWKCPLVG